MTSPTIKTGIDAVAAMFEKANSEVDQPLPFFTIGYPTYEQSIETIVALAGERVDGFEIGIPFSDPLADGPTIQIATQTALNNGITVQKCLDAVQTLRERGVQQPMFMMGYVNPMLAYGVERFVSAAKAAGADGLIIPDLPPEEADMFASACQREGLALVFFLAPTSNAERIELVAKHATGFIYLVSVTGITGARTQLPPDLTDYIARVRAKTDKPLVLGFGISTPEHARQLKGLVNGFIVASALIKLRDVEKVRELGAALRSALDD
ncbi:MAG: tryptophan synthase subunit alpha [Anaerolineae bacterium]